MNSEIDKCTVSPDTSIVKTIGVIDSGRYQSALIVDESRKLLGIVTDGDIRRAILRRVSLDAPIETIMNKNPVVASAEVEIESVKEIFISKQIRQLPIVNSSGSVTAIKTWDDVFGRTEIPNPVVLMAGGKGQRLYPLTKDVPKPLLRIGKKPILHTMVDGLVSQGFNNFFISVNYRADMVKEYFRDGRDFGARISYLCEDKQLGTAGSLSLLPKDIEHPVLVMNGDLLTKVDYRTLINAHNKSQADVTVCIREHEMRVPYGVVNLKNDRISNIDEKPVHSFYVNAGIYVFSPKCFKSVDQEEFLDMPELINDLASQGLKVVGHPLREYWIDIGRLDDLERANGEFGQEFQIDNN